MKGKIRYIVVDVDGTLTDAGIYYDEHGNELKKFCTKDAAGFFAAHAVGLKIIVLTGRRCAATTRRMRELKVDHLFQDIVDKADYLKRFMEENGIEKEGLAYIGDDLNDLPAMQLAGYIGCPADSCQEVIRIADFVSTKNGGSGAVRDVIEHYLRETKKWDDAIVGAYGIGR